MNHTVCQACLKSGDDVAPMSPIDIEWYNRLFKEVSKQSEMLMCIFCASLLRKLGKFVDQCHKASKLLNEVNNQNTLQMRTNLINISVSQTRTYYLGPDYDQEFDIKAESIFDCDDTYITEDEDEVPLVLFSGSNGDPTEIDVTVKKEMTENASREEKLKSVPGVKGVLPVKKNKVMVKKQKKSLREGFSSRMVQETSEYTVIKLTKEQVLQEMDERSKSEKYLRAPYKCVSCVKGFNFEDVLQAHMEKHSMKNGPLRCELCTQYCPSAVSMRGHMKSHTSRYSCKLCGYVRLSRQHVLEHHRIAHSSAAAAYTCEQCTFTTNKRTVMQRHVRIHYRTEPHTCHKCGKLYKSLDSLRVHTMRHENKKRFQCDQCNLSFVYPTLLHKHVQSVHVRRDYYCVECDIKFKSMDTLRLHFKRAKIHRDSAHRGDARTYTSRSAVRVSRGKQTP